MNADPEDRNIYNGWSWSHPVKGWDLPEWLEMCGCSCSVDNALQVNFEKPDYRRFPKFRSARGLEAVLGPGDVLYLPSYW